MTTAISPRLAAAPVALALLLAPLSACASTPPASESIATTPSEAATAAEAPASAAPTTAPAGTSSATSDVCAVLSEVAMPMSAIHLYFPSRAQMPERLRAFIDYFQQANEAR